MRHIVLTIALLLATVGAKAQQSYFAEALKQLIGEKNVEFSVSESNGGTEWRASQYAFSVAKSGKWDTQMAALVEAYNKDAADAEFAHMADGKVRQTSNAYVFKVVPTPGEPDITIGADRGSSIIVVRKNANDTGKRIVAAMEWKLSEADKQRYEGYIYIIYGPTKVVKDMVKAKKEEALEKETLSERQKRMLFYQQKAEHTSPVGEELVVGALIVADDIAKNGTKEDIQTAQKALDVIMSGIHIPSGWSDEYMKNSRQWKLIEGIVLTQGKLSQQLKRSFGAEEDLSAYRQGFDALPEQVWHEGSVAHPDTVVTFGVAESAAVDELLKDAKEFTKGNFKLEGEKDVELLDVGYYIYKGDDNFDFNPSQHDDIRMKGTRFSYACDLKDIVWGKLNAIMMDGTICSAWMELPFVPGEKAYLHVHDGHFSLSGSQFYKEWEQASNNYDITSQDILNAHIREYGYICYAFKSASLSDDDMQKIWSRLPKKIQNNHIGRFLKKFM